MNDALQPLAGLRTALLALGDLGRSPRAMYHALALARRGAQVSFVGYTGSPLPDEVVNHPRIQLGAFEPPERRRRVGRRLGRVGYWSSALRDVAELSTLVVQQLDRTGPFDLVLVQTPPALPSLALARYVAWRHGASLIFDWHNFTHSLLALNGQRDGRHLSALAASVRLHEQRLAPAAQHHLAVSDAMRTVLRQSWGLDHVTTFHDYPAQTFAPLGDTPRRRRRSELLAALGYSGSAALPQLMVTSTSYTKDERLDWLADALLELQHQLAAISKPAPHPLCVVVTGRGEGEADFKRRLQTLRAELQPNIQVLTGWLDFADYAALLASADLGISLHDSASGLDIPMKALDMLGAALPVAAIDYGPCLRERLDDSCGYLFRDSNQLSQLLMQLFFSAPGRRGLEARRQQLLANGLPTWQAHWDRTVLPMVGQLTAKLGNPGRLGNPVKC